MDDFLAIPEKQRFHELIAGSLVQRASPVWRHQRVASGLHGLLFGAYDKPAVKGRRGGWFLLPDVEIRFSARDVFRPDIAGWKRDQVPSDLDVDALCTECPAWVCEVLSPGHKREDTVLKRTWYAQYGVGHYWIVDPHKRTMTVLQLHGTHYKEVAAFGSEDIARAEPFAATPIRLARLFAVRN